MTSGSLASRIDSLLDDAVRHWQCPTAHGDNYKPDTWPAPDGGNSWPSPVLRMAVAPHQPESALSIGLPWLTPACNLRWLGRRLLWWPRGIPQQRRIAVASSRLSRHLDLECWWFDLLRTAVLRTDPVADCVCLVVGTAAEKAVRRAAQLWNRPRLECLLPAGADANNVADRTTLQEWISQRLRPQSSPLFTFSPQVITDCSSGRADMAYGHAGLTHCWIAEMSCEFGPIAGSADPGSGEDHPTDELVNLPIADRLLFAVGERICVLKTQTGGNVQTLVRRHLQDPERSAVQIHLAANSFETLSEMVFAPESATAGVIPWLVEAEREGEHTHGSRPSHSGLPSPLASDDQRTAGKRPESGSAVMWRTSRIESTPLTLPDEWLLHWTRGRTGPWPGQTEDQWLDELLLSSPEADRSARAVLLRIIAEGCLRASSAGIRGGFSVVAFTEVPLNEFRERRIFRKHRHRFDFEPWGIGIRRHVLQSLGAQPVRYRTDEDWDTIPEPDRPWFQKATNGAGTTNNCAEREWRLLGDCHLSQLPADCVCCFVDQASDAAQITQRCSWPAYVVPAPTARLA